MFPMFCCLICRPSLFISSNDCPFFFRNNDHLPYQLSVLFHQFQRLEPEKGRPWQALLSRVLSGICEHSAISFSELLSFFYQFAFPFSITIILVSCMDPVIIDKYLLLGSRFYQWSIQSLPPTVRRTMRTECLLKVPTQLMLVIFLLWKCTEIKIFLFFFHGTILSP